MSEKRDFWDLIPNRSIKMEVFVCDPLTACIGCVKMLKVVGEAGSEHFEKFNIILYAGEAGLSKFNEYNLLCCPALVLNEVVIINGVAPSKETLTEAIKEAAGLV